jgi:tetraacyldisaccharide 4'-kinase
LDLLLNAVRFLSWWDDSRTVFNPGTQVRWWLLWAAIPYGFVMWLRARCYERGWLARRKLPVPVVSVGNLTLGGTGKTPVVILVTEWLLAQRRRVAILSRGYRRTSPEPLLLVSDGERLLAGPREAGDEPFLIAQRCPKAIVAVGADRYALGRWVLDRFPVDCLVLDDGFQHLGLFRDENLLLIDATDVQGLDAVVPAGRLREPFGAMSRATAILITRADDSANVDRILGRLRELGQPLPDVSHVTFKPEGLTSVTTREWRDRDWCAGKTAILCSGVAHAGSFRSVAESMGLRVLDEVLFPDHHDYTATEVDGLRKKAQAARAELVVTTEKDAGKLAALLKPTDAWWAVRLSTRVIQGEEKLRQRILSCTKPVQMDAYASR